MDDFRSPRHQKPLSLKQMIFFLLLYGFTYHFSLRSPPLSFDSVVLALRPNLRAEFEQHPRNGHKEDSDEAKQRGGPAGAYAAIH